VICFQEYNLVIIIYVVEAIYCFELQNISTCQISYPQVFASSELQSVISLSFNQIERNTDALKMIEIEDY
jgi:hypothetical protein